jgi:hypothetical protein
MAACAVLAAVTGCGSGGGGEQRGRDTPNDANGSARSEEDRVRDAYDAFNQALADGDGKRFCELMTAEFRRAALASRAADCAAIMEKRLRRIPKGLPLSTVQRVTITGATADVAYGSDGKPDVDRMQMRKVAGDWLVDVGPQDDEPAARRGQRIPPAEPEDP